MPAPSSASRTPQRLIVIEPDRDGWRVVVPGKPNRRHRAATLHHARCLARTFTNVPEQIVVRDAYHRVMRDRAAVTARAGRFTR